MEALMKQLVEVSMAHQATTRELVGALAAGHGGVAAGATASRPAPSRFLLKQTETDDIEAYLNTFERTAVRENWDPAQWASLLAPFLSGTAQKAYQDLTDVQASNYEGLKKEILRRYGYTLISRSQRFHDWTYDATASPRSQMHDLIRLAKGWLTAAPLTLTATEKVVMDKFLRSLPYEAKKLASQANPQSADQLVELVEGHQAAVEVLRSGRPLRGEPNPRPKEQERERIRTEDHGRIPARETPRASPPRRRPFLNPDSRKCYECGEPGHIAWTCPSRDVSMPSASAGELTTGRPCRLLTVCWGEESGPSPVTPVKANGRDTTAMLDSGSMVTLIRPDFARSPSLRDTVAVTCIHGETKNYPTTLLHLQTTKGKYTGPVGVVPNLPVPVLIGRDSPLFSKLWASLAGEGGEDTGEGRGPIRGRSGCVAYTRWTHRGQLNLYREVTQGTQDRRQGRRVWTICSRWTMRQRQSLPHYRDSSEQPNWRIPT